MKRIDEIFNIQKGTDLGLNALQKAHPGNGINFVSRTSKNNGVSAVVRPLPGVSCLPAGAISVALSGSVLEAFVQPEPFYTGHHMVALTLKDEYAHLNSDALLFYYCTVIRINRYRYNFGRQANRTLRGILVPDPNALPAWAQQATTINTVAIRRPSIATGPIDMFGPSPATFAVEDLFDIDGGSNLELNALTPVESRQGYPFVSRTALRNGVSAYVKEVPNASLSPSRVLTVALGGSVLATFYQPQPFYTGRDIAVLHPRGPHKWSSAELLYVATVLKTHRFRYAYGRQANRTLGNLPLRLPSIEVNGNTVPDWDHMSRYILSLTFSSQLAA